MKIYELWGSTGSYSDYTEYRIAICSSQQKLDEIVARMMALGSITQAGPHSKKEEEENYIVMKHEDGHWTGRVLWQQYAHGIAPGLNRSEEMQIWSTIETADEDMLDRMKTRYL